MELNQGPFIKDKVDIYICVYCSEVREYIRCIRVDKIKILRIMKVE